MKIAIIGAGVLGTSMGVLLRRAGYEIVAVCSPNRRSAQEAATLIGAGDVLGDNAMAALGADLVLLAVPDRAIASVAIEVASGGALKRGAIVAHCAGGLAAGVLSGVRAAGAFRGSVHPLQSFVDVDAAVRMLPETFFFLQGDREAVDVLRRVVIAIDGRPVKIDGPDKALYHAGAAAASNFLVTLVDYAVSLLAEAGIPRDTGLAALLPLIKGTIENIESAGLPDALTGPIARGDLGTVKRHLRALDQMPGDMARLYRHLARKTIALAIAKGSLAAADAEKLLGMLGEPDFPGTGGLE